jgi:hypothetical protein
MAEWNGLAGGDVAGQNRAGGEPAHRNDDVVRRMKPNRGFVAREDCV